MATIRKRVWQTGSEPRTAWLVDYRDQDGKRRFKQFARKRDADAWMVGARHEVATGTHTPDTVSVTVAAAAELWLQRCEAEGLEPQTIRTYRNNARHHVLQLIGVERLSRLTAPRVEGFRDDLLRTRSREMARKALTTLKMIIGDAQRRGLVAQNVARDVRIKTQDRHRERVEIPTFDDMRALLARSSPRPRALIATAALAGLRSSELRALTWDDVDFGAKEIRVRRRVDRWNVVGSPKSAAGRRDVPMAPMLATILKEWKLACPRGELGLVFPNGAGRVENHGNIANRVLAPLEAPTCTGCAILRRHG